MWAGLRPQEPFHWKSAGGRPDVSPSKKRTPALSLLSLLLCLKIARFLILGAAPEELSAFIIWPSLNIEPTLSQISEETLESLKLREKNFERQTAPSNQQPKGIPRVMSRNDARDSLKPHRSSQLKQVSNKISIKWLNRVVFISKSKDTRVLLLMIGMGKIVWK